MPGKNGGTLLIGGTGAGGRPPNEHTERCRQMVSDPDSEKEVQAILQNRKHPAFATMWKTVAERGYGKPVQPIDVSGHLTLVMDL